MITSCNHSNNIICGSCLMKNHQEKQMTENAEKVAESLRQSHEQVEVYYDDDGR